MILLGLILLCIAHNSRSHDVGSSKVIPQWILRREDMSKHDGWVLKRFEEKEPLIRKMFATSRGSDGESIDAINHFFWGVTQGIAMELGAGNGVRLSETHVLVNFGWKRLLVEANPLHFKKLKTTQSSFCVGAAICATNSTVHFLDKRDESGIIEFMAPLQVKRNGGVAVMRKHAVQVPCVPLSDVIREAKVDHVNFFVLDTEGSEFNILQTINWDNVTFDVIVVETAESVRYANYSSHVAAYLRERNYEQIHPISGRNSWFKRVDFIPSRRPTISPHCYSGALWATRWRGHNHTQQDYFKYCPPGYFFMDKCQNCPMIHNS